MSQAPIMPLYTDAYLADTHHLSTEAHGAYFLLLISTWRNNGVPFADDDENLARMVRLPLRRWKIIRPLLTPFFNLSDGTWRQKRLEATWAEVAQKISTNRVNGMKGNALRHSTPKPQKNNNTTLANASDSRSPSINHKPLSNAYKKEDEKKWEEKSQEKAPLRTPNLDRMRFYLSNGEYFLPGYAHEVPRELKPTAEKALVEMEPLLTPAPPGVVSALVTRLMQHFPVPAGASRPSLEADYAAALAAFPQDILETSYAKILATHRYHTLPKIADFIAIAEPPHATRTCHRARLQRLLKKWEGG